MQSLWMIAASILFACMGVCVKLGSAQFSAAELVFFRSCISLIFVYGYMCVAGLSVVTPHGRLHVMRGIFGFVSLILYFLAISQTPLAMAVTLNYTSPLFLAIFLAFWQRDKIRLRLHLALMTGFLGIVLLLRPTWQSDQIVGGVCGLGSGILSSIAYINVRRLGELGEPEWRTVFYFSLISTLGSLPWIGLTWQESRISYADFQGWSLLFGVGGFGTLAQLCMTRAYKRGQTITAASLAYTTVIFSSFLGIWLWDERMPAIGVLGVTLIVASGMLTIFFSRNATIKVD